MEEQTYRIVRFSNFGIERRKIIHTGYSLKEAQEHCKREDTKGNGWFDGYERED